MSILYLEEQKVIADFIETSDEYFVIGYKKRLSTIKSRYRRDQYIDSMDFDSWNGMLSALDVEKDEDVVLDYIQGVKDKYKEQLIISVHSIEKIEGDRITYNNNNDLLNP